MRRVDVAADDVDDDALVDADGAAGHRLLPKADDSQRPFCPSASAELGGDQAEEVPERPARVSLAGARIGETDRNVAGTRKPGLEIVDRHLLKFRQKTFRYGTAELYCSEPTGV